MKYMLVRNKVRNYEKWKQVFDAHIDDTLEAELKLVRLWQSMDDSNEVFFLFEIGNTEKAKAFAADPANAEVGKQTGVLEGEIHYVEEVK